MIICMVLLSRAMNLRVIIPPVGLYFHYLYLSNSVLCTWQVHVIMACIIFMGYEPDSVGQYTYNSKGMFIFLYLT